MAKFSEVSLRSFLRNGAQLFGVKAFFYDAGTTTPRTMYQDADLTVAHAHPVIMNASGMMPVIYAGVGNYRCRLTDSDGALIDDFDGLEGSAAVDDGGTGTGSTFAQGTGDLVPSYSTASRPGAVRCNGKTIGSASSGATERANADCENLFLFLWNNDANLTVSGGRGGSAADDWAANKQINLPDMRGRTAFGLDTMGNTAASRYTGISFGAGSATTLGAYGGSMTYAIGSAHLPAVNISVTVAAGGSHNHPGSISDSIGAHLHSGSVTSFAGDHVHAYSVVSNGGNALELGATAATFTTSSISTGTAGNHQHSLSLVSDGNHQHSLDIALDGSHTHTAQTAPLGSGVPLPTAPGFVLVSWFILL